MEKIDNKAVSPVIGVILMVAITVVLAAVVFVLVSDLSPTEIDTTQVSYIKDTVDGDTVLTITSISGVVSYDNLLVKENGVELNYTLSQSPLQVGDTITLEGQHNNFVLIVNGRIVG